MIPLISILLFVIFLFLSSIHFYWAIGGRWGSEAVYPTMDDGIKPKMPGVVPTLIVAVGLLFMGLFILLKAGFIAVSIPLWISSYGLWILAAIFTIRAIGDFKYAGFFKKIKHTTFGQQDTKYYSPLCLLIVVLILILELNS
ncbi:DUF3995 domain-containing protein [uncultured Cytophaga sp.]|uniref:DUF3995 domain-containing protein n=1 Tax=uncultured Cytophaga sp. TaxID=160238 RepID=UPI00262B310C|nr:DUF3995 domain-containing protein [uncultured Cytophaga sp.]